MSKNSAAVANAYEAGRRRGLAECPCGASVGAADLEDPDVLAGAAYRQGALTALGAVFGLLVGAAVLGRRR